MSDIDDDDTGPTPVESLVRTLAALTCTLVKVGRLPSREATIAGAVDYAVTDYLAGLAPERVRARSLAFLIAEADDLREGEDSSEYREALFRFVLAAGAVIAGRARVS